MKTMEKNSKKRMVEVFKNIYAKPIYEMEVHGKFVDEEYEKTLKEEFEEKGTLPCSIMSYGVAYYSSKEEAFDAYNKMLEDTTEERTILAMHLREKVMGCMLRKNSYIHEWCYDNKSMLLDESILGSHDDHNYYYGRPADMIHHKKGDIVQYVNEHGDWNWGIVYGPPPTVEYIRERNQHLKEDYTGDVNEDASFFWYAYDSYLILTGKGDDFDFTLPPLVFKPMTDIPDFVKDILTEALERTKDKVIAYC